MKSLAEPPCRPDSRQHAAADALLPERAQQAPHGLCPDAARRSGGAAAGTEPCSILQRHPVVGAALIVIALSALFYMHRPCDGKRGAQFVLAAGGDTRSGTSPPAHGPSTLDRRRDRVYLLANNPNANVTWDKIKVNEGDFVVMFNLALPLDHFRHVPPRQLMLFLRQKASSQGIISEDQLAELSKSFHKFVFVTCKLAHHLSLQRKGLAEQLLALTHFEVLERKSHFMASVWATYPNNITQMPSTGYITQQYFQRHLPTHDVVLVGFSGEGVHLHDWEFETKYFSVNGVLRM